MVRSNFKNDNLLLDDIYHISYSNQSLNPLMKMLENVSDAFSTNMLNIPHFKPPKP